MTWLELAAIPDGTRVRFLADGTLGTIKENGLNEIWSALLVTPDDASEGGYDGKGAVHFSGPDPAGPEEDSRWYEQCPFELI